MADFYSRADHKGGRRKAVASSVKSLFKTRYVRIWMTEGAGGASETGDVRDRSGAAIREIKQGTRDSQGLLRACIIHSSDGPRLIVIFPSSTDPWHRAVDCDPHLLSKSPHQSLPTFYAAQLLTQQWAMPSSTEPHAVYRALTDIYNRFRLPLVTAYALHRPDRLWAILLLNKDPKAAHRVSVRFSTQKSKAASFQARSRLAQYCPAQYQWHPNRASGFPCPNLPPCIHG